MKKVDDSDSDGDSDRDNKKSSAPSTVVSRGKGKLKRGSSTSSESNQGEGEKQSIVDKRESPADDPMNFPRRLMDLLRRNERPDAIYWLPDGKMFAMHTGVIDEVLSITFQGAKFGSFTRTLNKWGFRKALGLKLPDQVVAYQNPYFQRDSQELVKHIRNHGRPSKKRRAAYEEQNFLTSSLQQSASLASAPTAASQMMQHPHGDTGSASTGLASPFQAANQAILRSPQHQQQQVSNQSILESLQSQAHSQLSSSILGSLGHISGSSVSANAFAAAMAQQSRGQQQDSFARWSLLQLPNRPQERQGGFADHQMLIQSLIHQGERRRHLQEQVEHQRLMELTMLERQNQQAGLRSDASAHQQHLAAATNQMAIAELENQERQRLMLLSQRAQFQQDQNRWLQLQQLLQNQQSSAVNMPYLDLLLQLQEQQQQQQQPQQQTARHAYEEVLQRQSEQKHQEEVNEDSDSEA